MASITKHKDNYRAQVCVKGERETKVFRTKREASAWAAERETFLRNETSLSAGGRYTLLDALRRYAEEESPKKKGHKWELVRLAAFETILPSGMKIGDVTTPVLAQWRDARMKQVSPGTVIREIGLLSAVLSVARREWQWIAVNPLSDVRRPPPPEHRDRIISLSEIRKILKSMNYTTKPVRSVTAATAIAFLFSLRTGVRAGEICSLPWASVYKNYCTVNGKTGIRDVPLSHQANRLIRQCYGWDDTFVIGLNTSTLDALFRRHRDRLGLKGFRFHDARHTAATRIVKSGRVDVLSLCKIFGWSNVKQAMTYFNPTGDDLAKMLSPPSRNPQIRLVSDRKRLA